MFLGLGKSCRYRLVYRHDLRGWDAVKGAPGGWHQYHRGGVVRSDGKHIEIEMHGVMKVAEKKSRI
jgi:hypothetical protein